MDIVTMLDELQKKSLHDPEVRDRFLKTSQAKEPITAFCEVCREFDFYELFMASIREGNGNR